MNTYEMYKGTTVEALSDGLSNVVQQYCVDISKEYFDNIYNISTAKGKGLDLWGTLLNFPRYIYNGEENGLELTDDEYRVVLQVVYSTFAVEPTIPNLNHVMRLIFGTQGLTAYVIDELDMGFITYVFTQQLPVWLNIVFYTYEILPRPMGVGARIREEPTQYLGFDGQNVAGSNIGNFTRSVFQAVSATQTASATIPATAITTLNNTFKDGEK